MLRTLLILGRTSNLPTVWTNVLAGWFVAGGSWEWELLWMAIGVSLLYVAGMTLNDAFDQTWDRKHAPERPIPSGAISGKSVWLIGGVQLVLGFLVLVQATSMDAMVLSALVLAILLYNAIHKKTVFGVVVMGACRGLVYLSAGSSVADWGERSLLWTALGTAIYVVGITVLARSERTSVSGKSGAGWLAYPMLAFPMLAAFVATPPDPLTKVIALAWFLPFFVWGCHTLIHQQATGAIGPMVGRLIAGIVLIDAAVMGLSDSLVGALVAVLLLPLTLLFQRRIPAT